MTQIKDIILKKIDEGSLEELKELKQFFQEESEEIITKINKRIDDAEYKNKKCAVCGREIADVEEPFVLYFGKKGFRKRAFFCGIDCLTYFLGQYRRLKDKRKESEKNKAFITSIEQNATNIKKSRGEGINRQIKKRIESINKLSKKIYF